MTLATSAFTTFSAVGNREDLTDSIYRIDPTDTPFVSGIERTKAKAVNHEWQTQALAAASNSNFQLEGDDNVTADAATATVRLGNICQIQTKIPRVTGTQRVVDSAGRDDEMSYQVMLKGLELRRDMETSFVGTNQAKVTGNATTPRKLASVLSWIKTNQSAAGTAPTAADGTDTRTDGTQRAFTESQLKTALAAIWTAGGKPDEIHVGAFNKQVFSTFTGRGTPTQNQAEKKITASVDVYESDFGKLKVVANRFQRSRDCFIFQMDMWAVAPLPGRSMITFDLAKTGDTDRKQLLSEHTLEARNEKSSGGVFDLTSA
jgi:hypothetical protein